MITDNSMRQSLISALSDLEEYQGEVSERMEGWGDLTSKQLANIAVTGLQVEVAELFQSLKIKPWRPDLDGPEGIEQRKDAADEFADVFAFIGMLMHVIKDYGVSPGDIARAYIGKSKVNRARFAGNVEAGRC